MTSLVKCKTCDKEIAKTAKSCPSCGAKNKKPPQWILRIFSASIALITIITIFGGSAVENAPKPPEIEYGRETGIDYRRARLGEIAEGKQMVFRGKVSQIGSYFARLGTKKNGWDGFSGDNVYLSFKKSPKLVERDVVQIKGRYDGVETYETVMGSKRSIPRIVVDYYAVLKERK